MTQIRARQTHVDNDIEADLPTKSSEPQLAKTPSWFKQMPVDEPYSQNEGDRKSTLRPAVETPDMLAYEAYKTRMEQRFREGQDIYDTPKANFRSAPMEGPKLRRPTLPLHEIQGRQKRYQLEQKNQKNLRDRSQSTPMPWAKMLALGSAAICIGAVAGFGFSNSALVKQKYDTVLTAAKDQLAAFAPGSPVAAPKAAVATNQSVIVKKPIATATLDVSDVRGTLGGMIPLVLSAQSADASEPISLKITGLPEQAYLTAGIKSLEGNWTLKPTELAEVKLVVPRSDVKQFDMEVSAVDDLTGALAAPTKAVKVELQNASPQSAEIPLTKAGDGKVNSEIAEAVMPPVAIVSPVSAVPETAVEQSNAPSAIPKAINEADDLVAKGNALLESGDIIAARQFFTQAAELGNAQGSFGVARSYDPKVFAKLNVVGLQPDEKMAADWYKKAADAGVVASTQ
jgi:hypothetical protein